MQQQELGAVSDMLQPWSGGEGGHMSRIKIYITVGLSEFLNAATGIGCCFRHAAAMVRG
jgi:hypothetical protein